jgi:RNA chaperone Hfq
MKKPNHIQEIILTVARRERRPVTVIITNGFQLKGRVTAFDNYTVVLESGDRQMMIYKHAISTIQLDDPIPVDFGEEVPS